MGKKSLKIAMIGHKRIPSREGGIEIVVDELSSGLVKLGNSVTVYNRKGHHVSGKEYDCGNQESSYKGVKLVNVFTINKSGVAAITSSISATVMVLIKHMMKKERCDCIHYHAEGPSAILWLPHLFRMHIVVTIHGIDWQRAKWNGLGRQYLIFGEKMAVKYADHIIVLSKNIEKYFMDTYQRKTVFIPNGINKPVLQSPQKITELWGLTKDSYILFLGRIVPEKGIHYLIEAFQQLKTDKKLVIAGGSSDTDGYVKQLKTLAGSDSKILFTNFVEGQVLDELYSNAYVYCLPSELEGMSIGLLEALSYGNCCVVSDIPECSEVVEDKGIVFETGNVKQLTQCLQQCCDDVELVNSFKREAADFVTSRYNWDTIVKSTLELYKKEQYETEPYVEEHYEQIGRTNYENSNGQ